MPWRTRRSTKAMISISSPAANLHSPGPIGDQTPGTGVFSTLASQVSISSGGTIDGANLQANAGGVIYWNGRSWMLSPVDGVISLTNNGATDFNRLQFGGTTSSFPAIKRSGTTLSFRLADDSADSPSQFSKINISAIPTSASGLSSGDVYSNAGILTIVP